MTELIADKILQMAIVAGVLIVLRESFKRRDEVKPSKAVSNWWHIYGWFMRLFVIGIVYQVSHNWWYVLFMVVLLFPIYNIGCAIGGKQKWYYLSGKGIDGLLLDIWMFIKKQYNKLIKK